MKVIVEADGGSRGNPGPAGYGAGVWSADRGTVLAERKEAIGRATNNVAEYRGLIAGLQEALDLGATEVEVFMDSKLVVEQMSGRWKVKHPDIAQLHRQATALTRRFDKVGFTWIARDRNSHADRLANEAMDAAAAELAGDRGSGSGEGPAEASSDPDPDPSGEVAKSAAPQPAPVRWSGARGAPTRFLLLRHGQTELSIERRYSGRGNPALTPLGRRQAELAARYIAAKGGISAVISSPLQRAYDTAATAAKALGLDVGVDEDLIETDFGAWEGLTFSEAAERDPELHRRWLRDTSVAPPGGESFDEAARRVARARERLVAEYQGQTVLVVSHVTPIKSLLRTALDADASILFRIHLDLASLSIAEFYPDGPAAVRLVNQTAYLE